MSLGRHPRFWSVFMLMAVLAVMTIPTVSAAQDTPEGLWTAVVASPQGDVTVTLNLEVDGTNWSGTISDSQEGQEKDLEALRVNGNRVQFRIPVPEMNTNGEFTGVFDAEANTLVGEFGVSGFPQKQDMTFRRQVIEEGSSRRYRAGSGPAGVWQGMVRSPDGEDSQVTLTLDRGENDGWVATLEDPFVSVVRGEDVQVTSTMISFTFRPEGSSFPANFTGTYIAADDRVSGSFSQRGVSRFVKFRRDPDSVVLGVGPDGKPKMPARDRHPYKLALTGRLSYWAALHLVKDEVYNINNMTKGELNYDLALKWHAMDQFALFARYYRGGLGFTDDAAKLAPFEGFGLNSESYLKLDGFEFGFNGYLGNAITPNGNWNPYLTMAVGRSTWELNESGRGSSVIEINRQPVKDKGLSFAAGLGTEYMFSDNIALELELVWRYFKTKDEAKWPDADTVWNNTHAWAWSAGLTWGFF